jgi:hypothetical protein
MEPVVYPKRLCIATLFKQMQFAHGDYELFKVQHAGKIVGDTIYRETVLTVHDQDVIKRLYKHITQGVGGCSEVFPKIPDVQHLVDDKGRDECKYTIKDVLDAIDYLTPHVTLNVSVHDIETTIKLNKEV